MVLMEKGRPVRVYGVSTSKFGLGDQPSSNRTPVGKMRIAAKVGQGQPPGAVFRSRRPTGRVVRPDTPGRDTIVTRILQLQGEEGSTRNTYRRNIYIHGTTAERYIGMPASYGCIRMRSMDIIDLFDRVPVGTPVRVEKGPLPGEARRMPEYVYVPPSPAPQRGKDTPRRDPHPAGQYAAAPGSSRHRQGS